MLQWECLLLRWEESSNGYLQGPPGSKTEVIRGKVYVGHSPLLRYALDHSTCLMHSIPNKLHSHARPDPLFEPPQGCKGGIDDVCCLEGGVWRADSCSCPCTRMHMLCVGYKLRQKMRCQLQRISEHLKHEACQATVGNMAEKLHTPS